MPTEFAAHHVAYIPSLPDELQDYYLHVYGTAISADMLTFCKRELMQCVWLLLLDDEFLDAYENGILVQCGDGVTRRIFPRILSYSADYPEKILLAALKPLSKHPCPRCLVPKDELCLAGTPDDMHNRSNNQCTDTPALSRDIKRARKYLFQGASLGSKRVQALLGSRSLNPIESAFSVRLNRFRLNHYQLFAPDLMHEFELGVWKSTFAHLLRLLAAQGGNAVQEFNRRMRNMPTFGRDTIRKFWHDVASRKQLAARDYEDFLILANWHALAKLRLHTTVTIKIFRAATEHMCRAMRSFARTTCKRYDTRELPKETQARIRREKGPGDTTAAQNGGPKTVELPTTTTLKWLNSNIATPSVTTAEQTGSGTRYRSPSTSGVAALLRALRELDDYVPRRERRRQRANNSHLASQPSRGAGVRKAPQGKPQNSDDDEDGDEEPLLPTPPVERYAISQTRRVPLRLSSWLTHYKQDSAIKVSALMSGNVPTVLSMMC
ncbi:hypothetical protein NUW54_g11670 [Trametes sanguinea]|uniref:Uncharacterized protein n=1 Tax=Trametes sanguinea TaxID=158606 RepID=A0ACC1NAI6_9APHY|nr:hypothetical protein NUW54_g11670 [Trametes sanguinea]